MTHEIFLIKGRGPIFIVDMDEPYEPGSEILIRAKVTAVEFSGGDDKGLVLSNLRPEDDDAKKNEELLRSTGERCHLQSRRHYRLTKLLRAALPEEAQVGNGLEGMIESLLALALKTNYPGVEEPSKEEVEALLPEDSEKMEQSRKHLGLTED